MPYRRKFQKVSITQNNNARGEKKPLKSSEFTSYTVNVKCEYKYLTSNTLEVFMKFIIIGESCMCNEHKKVHVK